MSTGISSEFRANNLCYRIATPADDATLRSILRQTPMTSWVTLSTEHEPSYFASSDLFGQRTTIVSHKSDSTTVGMCSYTALSVHIDGSENAACYLGELRVLPEFRHRPAIVKNGFRSVEKFSGALIDKAHWFTSIASENGVARRFLEANLKGMPIYRRAGELVTMALSTGAARQPVQMRPATEADVPALVAFYNRQVRQYQYSPVLTEDWLFNLNRGNGLQLQDFYLLKVQGSIRACFAIWDQRQFKQTVVRGYRFPLNIMRLPCNLFSRLTGRVELPAIGDCIDYVFIAFLAVSKSMLSEYRGIIATALKLARHAGAEIAMLGLSANSPNLNLLDTFHKQTYRSQVESVSWPNRYPTRDRPDLFSEDAVIQPEIALL